MTNKIFVGNLSYTVTNNHLIDAFSEYGNVQSAKVITDRELNRSKGFAFVEMGTSAEAQVAISNLNGAELEGRKINVSVANDNSSQERKSFKKW